MTGTATGRGVRIAVIDSGVNPDHAHIEASRLAAGAGIRGDGSVELGAEATLDRLGHGTAVMAAIQEKAPGATCIPIRVFHDSLRTTGLGLIAALDWAIAQRVDVINLSLGSTTPAHAPAFGAAIERANRAATIVVAPREVDGAPCYPGAIDGVIGVGIDWDCPRAAFRVAEDQRHFLASGYPRPIPGVPPRRNLYGISFATAQLSGFAACALENLPSAGPARITALRTALYANAR
ncbi:Subtilase family protein [Novosphingobium sp. CF614]|uniref:subtilisin-like serine protease QhpE n=1 Tax=Novosphingobium sp. CF614 TaxID=1884364 RepID=UPI0008E3BDBD|nr:S8 family serine peptidase [Novosphingobium sp. CF614]SFF91638.1 Subtilase family protein [Novosphingobium sp. CF614]